MPINEKESKAICAAVCLACPELLRECYGMACPDRCLECVQNERQTI